MSMQRMTGPRAAGILPLASVSIWIVTAACDGRTVTPLGPEASDTAEVTGSSVTLDTVQAVAWIEMRPSQLYMDSLAFAVQTRARAYAAGGHLLYSSVEMPERFSWSSSEPGVVSVDPSGSVTSESWGTAMVTATHRSGLSATTRVRVRDAMDPAWSIFVGTGEIVAGIVIGPDGTIYVATHDYPTHRSRWSAVTPAGSVLWSLDLPLTGFSTPAIGDDGTLYVGSWSKPIGSGSLTAIDPSGSVSWVLDDIDPVNSSPAIGSDGTIYVSGSKHLNAVDPQGGVDWAYQTPDEPFGVASPAIASDGTIYLGGYGKQMHAITPDGSLLWTFPTEDVVTSSPAIGPDGTIYFGSHHGPLHALRPDGTERWSLRLDPNVGTDASPSVAADGTIYIMDCNLFAVDPAGTVRWTYPAGSCGAQPPPAIGADGTVYYGSFRGMAALDAQGNLLWTHPLPDGESILAASAIGVDGAILVASHSGSSDSHQGFLHALVENGSTNGGFEAAAWPTERGGRANTGRVGG